MSTALPDAAPPAPWTGRTFTHGLVSTNHRLASEAGAAILERGGSAVDAAVAALFVLNVVEPQNSGIGGAAQLLVHGARGEAWAVDGREQAAAAATPDQLVGKTDFHTSGIAVAVPGMLRAAEVALRRFGTRPLAELLAPAVRLAEEGFAVSPALARALANLGARPGADLPTHFRGPGGQPLQAGERLVQPQLARTLRLVAERGTEVFYRGEIAQAIVAAVGSRGRLPGYEGRITVGDLARYDVAVRRPLSIRYRGTDVVSFPPSSSGGLVLLESLRTLERFGLGDGARGFGAGSWRTLNVLLEAARLAHADRVWWSGDDAFGPVPAAGLLDDGYVQARGALLDPDRRLPVARAGDPARGNPAAHEVAPSEPGGTQTTHLSVADAQGNLVACTATLADGFGSGLFVPEHGFFLNDSGIKFNAVPRRDPARDDPGANDAGPGKRPNGFMAPTLLARAGRPFAALGSPGGGTIPTTVLHVVSNLLDHRLPVQEAIDAPRFALDERDEVQWEAKLGADVVARLAALGHRLARDPIEIGSVQAVEIDLETGLQRGGADRRTEGFVAGPA